MEFISSSSIKTLSNPGVDSRQLLNPENSTSKRVTLTEVTVAPGAIQPRHSHDASEQIWICTKGKGMLLLAGDMEKEFSKGDVVRFEDKDIHGIRNDSDSPLTYISATCPPIDFSYAYRDKK